MMQICVSFSNIILRKDKTTFSGYDNPIFIYLFFWILQPKHCRCRPCTFSTVEDYCCTWWHSLTHHSRYDSSGRVIGPLQGSPFCNIWYAHHVHILGEIRTCNSNQWAATGFGWLALLFSNYKNTKWVYFTTLYQVSDLKLVKICNA